MAFAGARLRLPVVGSTTPPPLHGRGAQADVPNRFEPIVLDPSERHDDPDGDAAGAADARAGRGVAVATRYFEDRTQTALTYNTSPDIPFEVSLNPYRGCEHGCSYCYARPFHEFLGLSAGLDFESVIFCKPRLPELLRGELARPTYRPSTITISGVTDGYQPVERRLRIVRGCLEVLAACRHPVNIVTKSHLVTRDLDVLSELAKYGAARVDISVTTLDADVARRMEPRASSPSRRLDAIAACAAAGVPVGVLVSPVVPGLTDHELPQILSAAAEAGAGWAHFIPLRLPGAVEKVFLDWLSAHYPQRAGKVVTRVRSIRGGKLNESRFGYRFGGQGPFYAQLEQMMALHRRRLRLEGHGPRLSAAAFRRPERHAAGQLALFGDAAE